ncbi:MAG: translocation/assembly module TamB domain-containing protein [Deltaproteobacteria bacterium]|nr:translocation/assembly module TamB domain-containing protein [Deltaproteobacteria bacterium]
MIQWIRHLPWKKLIVIACGLLLAFLLGIYAILSSETVFAWAFERLNHSLPGDLSYQHLSLSGRRLVLKDLHYKTDQGEALWIGQFTFEWSPALFYRGQLKVNLLKVEGLTLDLKALPKRKEGASLNWRSLLKLLLKRISLESGQFRALKLTIKEGVSLSLDQFLLQLTPQVLENQSFALTSHGGLLQLGEETLKLQELVLKGDVDIPVLGSSFFFVQEASSDLQLAGLAWRDYELRDFKTKVEVDGTLSAIEEASFKSDYGDFKLDGFVDWEEKTWELNTETTRPIVLEKIPKMSERVPRVFQELAWKIKAEGKFLTLKDLAGDLDLEVKAKGTDGDYLLQAQGPLRKGTWFWDEFAIRSGKAMAKVQGSISAATQSIDAKVQVENIKIENIINAVSDLDIFGVASGEGKIWGSLKGPNFDVQARGMETGYQFLHFGPNQGTFKIIDGTLSYVGSSPPSASYQASVEVRTQEIYKKTRRTQLKSRFSGLEAERLLEIPEIQGKIEGTFEMQAQPEGKKQGKLQAKVQDAKVYGFSLESIESEGTLKDQEFILDQVRFKPQGYTWQQIPQPALFSFNDEGWKLKGKLLPGFEIQGQGGARHPEKALLQGQFDNIDLRPLLAAMNFPAWESYGWGKINMDIGIGGRASTVDLRFDRLEMPLEEGKLRLVEAAELKITPPWMRLKPVQVGFGNKFFEISGNYRFEGDFDVKFEGSIPLALFNLFPEDFKEAKGEAVGSLSLGGTYENPSLSGELEFSGASLRLRSMGLSLENLEGTLGLSPQKFLFKKLRARTQQGDLELDGVVNVQGLDPTFYDLNILAREVTVKEAGVYRLIFSGEFSLKGEASHALLSGALDINEGIYRRNFDLSQSGIALSGEKQSGGLSFLEDFLLDLTVRSPGELAIKNNVAQIFFNSDLTISGSFKNPKVKGALEVLEGSFQYFTVEFETEQGRIEFRDGEPYVDIVLRRDIESSLETFIVRGHVQGYADNLRLDFSSDPPLDQQRLLALVITGALPGQSRSLNAANLGAAVIAGQLSSLLARPLEEKFKLDIFRIEAADSTSDALSTLVLGKKLTDRFSLQFKTDLGVDASVQGVEMEYLLLDNILIKASQLSDGVFDINLALRFELF